MADTTISKKAVRYDTPISKKGCEICVTDVLLLLNVTNDFI